MKAQYQNVTVGMIQRALGDRAQSDYTGVYEPSEVLESLAQEAFDTGQLKLTGDGTLIEHLPFPGGHGHSIIRVHAQGKETYSVFCPTEANAEEALVNLATDHGGWQ